jgi:hypothetical protein
MRNDIATAKSLREALINGFDELDEARESGDMNIIQAYIHDFIAQRFTVAIFNPNISQVEAERLRLLFLSITKL